MANPARIRFLWSVLLWAVTAPLLSGCSGERQALTPTGPAAPPSAPTPTPAAPVVEIVLSGTVTDLQDVPISGAVVTAWGLSRLSTTMTDDAGRFTLQADHVDPTAQVFVSANKDGYVTRSRNMASADRVGLPFRLPALLQLPIDNSLASALLAVDPPTYVGEVYDSDYSSNTKYFSFTIPATADRIVEIAWKRVENSALMMWAFDGRTVSERTDTGATIRLPRGTTGMLLVGRPQTAGALLLSQSVPFTLTTRPASP